MEIIGKVGRVRSLGRYTCLGQDGTGQEVPTPCKSDTFADYKGEISCGIDLEGGEITSKYYPDLDIEDVKACVRYAILGQAYFYIAPGRHRIRTITEGSPAKGLSSTISGKLRF